MYPSWIRHLQHKFKVSINSCHFRYLVDPLSLMRSFVSWYLLIYLTRSKPTTNKMFDDNNNLIGLYFIVGYSANSYPFIIVYLTISLPVVYCALRHGLLLNIGICYIYLIAFILSLLRTWNNMQTDTTDNSQIGWHKYSNS